MQSEAYATLAAEVEALGGIVDESRGQHHDLSASYARVVARYFPRGIAKPNGPPAVSVAATPLDKGQMKVTIEYQDARVEENRAGNREPLLQQLTKGARPATLLLPASRLGRERF